MEILQTLKIKQLSASKGFENEISTISSEDICHDCQPKLSKKIKIS